mmetsp:Transcript_64403/g.112449  ORF Transcript_64403/g.112449 Transcript_64403/m.112449 type:complete len:259 (-) Transcript_64403:675-1451(-)
MPLLKAISAVEIGALHAVKQCDALLAFCTHAHFHPSPAMILSAACAVQPLKAALAQEIAALITKQDGIFRVFLRALDAHLHVLNPPRLLILCTLKLLHNVSVSRHEVAEVSNIFHLFLLLHDSAVMSKSTLQDMHKVRLILDAYAEDVRHFDDILNRLNGWVNTTQFTFPSENAREQELNAKLHDGFPVRQRFLLSGDVEHFLILLKVRVIVSAVPVASILPKAHAFVHPMSHVGRLRLIHESPAYPNISLVCGWVKL